MSFSEDGLLIYPYSKSKPKDLDLVISKIWETSQVLPGPWARIRGTHHNKTCDVFIRKRTAQGLLPGVRVDSRVHFTCLLKVKGHIYIYNNSGSNMIVIHY